ncbi:hypothetical protein ACS0TY_016941 [Phlomoides rotata]
MEAYDCTPDIWRHWAIAKPLVKSYEPLCEEPLWDKLTLLFPKPAWFPLTSLDAGDIPIISEGTSTARSFIALASGSHRSRTRRTM